MRLTPNFPTLHLKCCPNCSQHDELPRTSCSHNDKQSPSEIRNLYVVRFQQAACGMIDSGKSRLILNLTKAIHENEGNSCSTTCT
jgi:hypothetical protein